ncbi:MAG TPA: cytochrome ubiquinol oxidase subunit I [Gammaproteobacteria bacterium]|nr:cytochrome ubiquinol oxidase subunit I [Gammaproteobacteria bacterium]
MIAQQQGKSVEPSQLVVELSRWQFAVTVLYHFLFVPLTIGLGVLLAAMETVYVVTRREIFRDMTKFWSKLFVINFALGVATGLTMEFQFGTNWAFYSHFVGDVFGAPLAIESLMAFFLESTLVGIMIFGWDRLSRGKHLFVTYMVALGANLSALWILIANGFMQHPIGAHLDPATLRMQLSSFSQLIFSIDAQAKFVHTTAASYVLGSMFVCAVSAFYLLRRRHVEIARRSFRMAAIFGAFASIAVITLGDASGFVDVGVQPPKIAAMEAMWHTEKPPAGLNLIAIPSEREERNLWELKFPAIGGLMLTHGFTEPVLGVKELIAQARQKVRDGIPALLALHELQKNPTDAAALATYKAHQKNIGYALLLQRYAPDVSKATPAQVERAAKDTIPLVWAIFWTFHLMVYFGLAMFAFFVLASMFSLTRSEYRRPWLLRLAIFMPVLPWLTVELGWITAELGRQPWTVYGILPTWLSASTHSVAYMIFSLTGFVLLYTIFIVIEVYLMGRAIRKGPEPELSDEEAAGPPQLVPAGD